MTTAIDLATEDLDTIERLGNLAGLKTPAEVVRSAVSLLKWSATEALYGRTICSIDEESSVVKRSELPALAAFYELYEQHPLLTAEQAQARLQEPSRPSSEFRMAAATADADSKWLPDSP